MKKPYVVAIAGGTCSGKTTLTDILHEKLEAKFSVCVMNMDKYFKKSPPTTIAPITRIEYVEHNHPTTLEMDRLLADFAKALEGDADLLLVEGLFSLYTDEIREAADLKIFVDLASDERLTRRIKRHLSWGQSLEEITDRYLDTVRFRHNELIEPTRWHADFVLNGSIDRTKGADVALAYILSQLS